MHYSEIIAGLDRAIAETGLGTLEPGAAEARRTIAASADRARLPEKRISAAARMSIACAGMAFAGKLAAAPRHRRTKALAEIADACARLAEGASLEHSPSCSPVAVPEGWDGPEDGPFRKSSQDGPDLVLSRREHLPGGDWTFHYGMVPAAFGTDPAEAAERGRSFEQAVRDSRRIPPPARNRARA